MQEKVPRASIVSFRGNYLTVTKSCGTEIVAVLNTNSNSAVLICVVLPDRSNMLNSCQIRRY